MKFALLLLTLLSASAARAGDLSTTRPADDNPATRPDAAAPAPADDAAADKAWSLSLKLDYTPKYFFRGYLLPPGTGNALQPSAEFDYRVYKNDAISITPFVNVWENLTARSGPRSPKWFTESDLNAGAKVDWNNFELLGQYTLYSYPDGSLHQTQEIGFTLTYDDSGIWGNNPVFAAVNPHLGYYHEIQDTPNRQIYMEAGIEPTFKPLTLCDQCVVTFSIPMIVGLGDNGTYSDNTGHTAPVGYWTVGAKATFPLKFIPKGMGDWQIQGEIDYIRLNAATTQAADGGKSHDIIGRVELSVGL